MFPKIHNIKDVLPHIEGRDEFYVADKGDHVIINYRMMGADTFPDDIPILRECRGIVFDKETGNIIRRPLHKFFNIGERESTRFENLHWLKEDYHIFEKLDGSMISPYTVDGEKIIWGTKMGDTDVAKQAEKITTVSHREFFDFCDSEILATAIYEYTSPYNQIVVPYEEERLSLLAVRDWYTGEYYHYENLLAWGELFGLDVVKQYDSGGDIVEFLKNKKTSSGEEGVILSSPCGFYKVKDKNEWYVRIHKALERIVHEKDILQMILEEKLDDVLPFLSVTLANKVRDYEVAFWKNFNRITLEMDDYFADHCDLERKEFAMIVKERKDSRFLFKLKDFYEKTGYFNPDIIQGLLIDFLTNLSTSSKVEQNRWLIGTEWRMNSEDFQ